MVWSVNLADHDKKALAYPHAYYIYPKPSGFIDNIAYVSI